MSYKISYFVLGAVLGIFLSLIIYTYTQNKLDIKNLLKIKCLKNYKLVICVCFINGLVYFLGSKHLYMNKYTVLSYVLCSLLLCLAVIDIKTFIVPESINIIILIIAIINVTINNENYIYHLIGFFSVSLPFWIIAILTKGIGGGDIKLFAVSGLFLGIYHIFLAMFICCILASIFGIFLKIFGKTYMENGKQAVALVPYICVGVVVAVIYGDVILDWYISLI